MRCIKTKKGLETLLQRYLEAGVTDETEDIDGDQGFFITTIKGCIANELAMDEIDYTHTPFNLKPLWKGLK